MSSLFVRKFSSMKRKKIANREHTEKMLDSKNEATITFIIELPDYRQNKVI